MAIAITYLEEWPAAPRNSVSLIDRHGDLVFTYAKVHTCDFDVPEAATTPGDDFYVGALDSAVGPVQIGAMKRVVTLDLAAVPFIKQRSHLPVLVDPSHGTGRRELVAPMARAACLSPSSADRR